MKKAPTASFDGLGKATCTALAGILSVVNSHLHGRVSSQYLPWLLFCDPKIGWLALLLTEANIIVMATNELVSERLKT